MDDKKPLQIYIKPATGQKFHKDIGWLELQKAESFTVSVKNYEDEKNNLIKKFDEESSNLRKKNNDSLRQLQRDYNNGNDFIQQNHKEHLSGSVTAATYKANLEAYNRGNAERDKRNIAINNGFNKDLKDLKDKHNQDLKDLKTQYQNIRWVWQLIGSRRPVLNKDSFNEKIKAGQPELTLYFDDLLEGGGGTYIEPFWDGDNPVGKYPNGILVNAIGQDPKIITAQWTDAEDKEITDVLQFGSSVYLNIYTSSLYGNNLKIQLKDKDKVIRFLTLGYRNADDQLFATEYLNNDLENRTEDDVTKQGDFFERPVNVHTAYTVPSTAKTGYLVQEDEDNTDGETTSKPNVQKAKFAVFIDPIWESLAGSELEIYPIVYNNRISKGKEEVPEKILKISATSNKIISVNPSNSNQVAVLSEVETNLQHFSPCGYNTILALIGNDQYPVFSRKTSEIETELHLEVISDDKTKIAWLYIPDLNTIECTYNNVIEYHTEKVIFLKDPKEHYKNLNLTATDISFDINYPKPTVKQLESYSWLPNAKPKRYNLQFNTCRFQHPLLIDVYPDLEYTFNAHLGVDEEKYLYVKQSKNYKKRKYKAKKGSDTAAAKKAYNKRQKTKYKADVNDEITSGNLLKEYQFAVEFEGSFAGEKSISLELGFAKAEEIIEKVMYFYSIIDSYVGGTAMKEAESKPETSSKFKADKSKRKKKRKEYGTDLPVRFEVTPPKFTGGVTWKYAKSTKEANLLGVEYEFKLGALPLIGVAGRLDLLFAAQFIPYINVVVKALDRSVATISKAGEVMQFFGVGNMEADYYFDFVCATNLNIDFTNGAKWHTIDGYTGGDVGLYSEVELGLEAGGFLKVKVFDIVGEAAIHAETKAKFIFNYTPARPKYLKFEFEGIEALIFAKINVERGKGRSTSNSVRKEETKIPINSVEGKVEKTKKFDEVEIFKPFEIDIKLFD